MVNSNNVTRKFTMKEKLASLGPGFVIVGSFIGPGTVTSCTLAGHAGDGGKDRYHHSGRARRKHEA